MYHSFIVGFESHARTLLPVGIFVVRKRNQKSSISIGILSTTHKDHTLGKHFFQNTIKFRVVSAAASSAQNSHITYILFLDNRFGSGCRTFCSFEKKHYKITVTTLLLYCKNCVFSWMCSTHTLVFFCHILRTLLHRSDLVIPIHPC